MSHCCHVISQQLFLYIFSQFHWRRHYLLYAWLWIKDWINSLFFSTGHHGPGASGTTIANVLSVFSLYWKAHAFGRLCTEKAERTKRTALIYLIYYFPVISWLPLLNCTCKIIIMRTFHTFTAWIFIVLEND